MRKRFDQTLGKFDEKVFLYTGKAIKIYGGAVAMQKTIEVVYEDGVFKPLEPVEMEEGERMTVEVKKLPENLFGIFRGKDLKKLLEETEDEWGIY